VPQDSKQASEKKSAQPSPGLIERIFGSGRFTPEMEEGIRIAKKEMPNMAPVQPYGFFSRLAQPNALAYVAGGGNIYLNPDTNAGQTPQEIADTLTHEQQHVKQLSAHSPSMNVLLSMLSRNSEPYGRRPVEMEAYQAEKERRARMGRTQAPIPSFSTPGEFYVPKDTNLPNLNKR